MLYALLAIAVLVGLVTWLKLNPFIALLLSSLALGAMVVATQLVAPGMSPLTMAGVLDSFQTGFGRTLASTGSIIVLGVVFGAWAGAGSEQWTPSPRALLGLFALSHLAVSAQLILSRGRSFVDKPRLLPEAE